MAIVDDDAFIRAALARLVRSIGYEALLFDGAAPLLSYTALDGLFCVLADLQMPRISGIELIQILAIRHPALPVVAMTAYPRDATRLRALESGAAAYLTKPFDADLLENCLLGFSSHRNL
ncbi:response regulator transcription factor [Teichococcus vastitatis]|uniref:Response regulator n=1 Tax=Teichococcus vastitatis TaxID=2307076 RepID=A0ABS9W984_9PROT|nr:response regulator [Pseudoroseomonas vastitatis]